MGNTDRKDRLSASVDARAAELDRLSLEIHARPELGFEERFASGALADLVERESIKVERGAHGIETAFVAEIGSGKPVIALCAEYDALPGVGHACGHNLMGTASAGAFLALKDALDGMNGTVKLIGTPAEEGGNGKVKLIEAGAFKDVDVALMYHAGSRDEIAPLLLALSSLRVEMRGKAAHAAGKPHEGINALDGLLLGWSALSALRLVIRSDARVHGIITDGGQAPNIIPERAAAHLLVRSPDNAYLAELRTRVVACFEGGAKAAGCEMSYVWPMACESLTTNPVLAELFTANARVLGREMVSHRPNEALGSSDMGNVSTIIPSLHPLLSITDREIPGHSRDFAAAAATPRALETMRVGAKALAMTAFDVLADPSLAQRAWELHNAR